MTGQRLPTVLQHLFFCLLGHRTPGFSWARNFLKRRLRLPESPTVMHSRLSKFFRGVQEVFFFFSQRQGIILFLSLFPFCWLEYTCECRSWSSPIGSQGRRHVLRMSKQPEIWMPVCGAATPTLDRIPPSVVYLGEDSASTALATVSLFFAVSMQVGKESLKSPLCTLVLPLK